MTAVDLLTQPALMEQAKAEFEGMIDRNAAWRQQRYFS